MDGHTYIYLLYVLSTCCAFNYLALEWWLPYTKIAKLINRRKFCLPRFSQYCSTDKILRIVLRS